MNRMPLMAAVVLVAAIMMGTGSGFAQSAQYSTAYIGSSGSLDTCYSMFLVPDGSGTPLTSCFEWGGIIGDATITVIVRDDSGAIVAGVPADYVRLEQLESSLVWCDDTLYPADSTMPNRADGPSDEAGVMTFSTSYLGGSWDEAPTYVWLWQEFPLPGAWYTVGGDLCISYNSADISGDLVVNLTDLTLFAIDFYADEYTYQSDFNYDGEINLIDLTMFAPTMGAECP